MIYFSEDVFSKIFFLKSSIRFSHWSNTLIEQVYSITGYTYVEKIIYMPGAYEPKDKFLRFIDGKTFLNKKSIRKYIPLVE